MIEKNNVETHPCFAPQCNEFSRMHLPVAPKCNIQCNYCLRKYSCVNESRPGVTAKIMDSSSAFEWYKNVRSRVKNLSVVGIAGPGDALANWNEVKKVLKLIHTHDSKINLCLSTNGLLLPKYAEDIILTGIKYLTITLNCIDPKIGAQIYDYVIYDNVKYTGIEGAGLLFDNQIAGIKLLKDYDVNVKINCVAIDGINSDNIRDVAKTAKQLKCDVMNVIPMIPVAGSKFERLNEIDKRTLNDIRVKCSESIRQMYHCNRCRADAVGRLK